MIGSAGGRRLARALVFLLLCALAGIVPGPVGAAPGGLLGVEQTEALVRRVDYAGMPQDEAARIGPAGGARLIEMLADPEERPHHARILLALGSWGGSGAIEAIRSWRAGLPAKGELDRGTFRAWQSLPFALARLARQEPGVVADLTGRFDADPPGWSFRQFRGERLRALEQRAAATALAETRLPEAVQALEALANRPHPPALAEHLQAVQAEMQIGPQVGARPAAIDRTPGVMP